MIRTECDRCVFQVRHFKVIPVKRENGEDEVARWDVCTRTNTIIQYDRHDYGCAWKSEGREEKGAH